MKNLKNALDIILLALSPYLSFSQNVNIYVHSNAGVDASLIQTAYSNAGFVNVTQNVQSSVIGQLDTTNYDVAILSENYVYGSGGYTLNSFSSAEIAVIESFVNGGGHIVWIAESWDTEPISGNPVTPNTNCINLVNTIFGTTLSYGPFFSNGGMGSPNAPRIHPSNGPGGISSSSSIITSGSYSTLLNVLPESAVFTSDFYDNINFFDPCTHTTVAVFPSYPVATDGTVLISTELGLPFQAIYDQFGNPSYNTSFDGDIAEMHHALITGNTSAINNMNSWSQDTLNVNPNCPPTSCEAPVITLSTSTLHICPGDASNGAIDVNISGGQTPYTFDWSNDGTGDNDDTEDLSNLGAGTYNLTVYENNGCSATFTAEIQELPVINVSDQITSETNGNDGAIDIAITSGTAPFTFDWDNDGTGDNDDTEDLSGLSGGNYTVIIMDSLGCSSQFTFQVGSTVSIAETEEIQFLIYPNPVHHMIYIENVVDFKEILLHNSKGKNIVVELTQVDDLVQLKLPGSLATGTYFLTVHTKNGSRTTKLILE